VAGATRGCGRGIAAALGEAGATVVCTGRSSRTAALRSDYDRAETIEETAAMVTMLGGTGLADRSTISTPIRCGTWPVGSAAGSAGSTCSSTTSGGRSCSKAAASRYRISVFYDLAKVAVNRLAFSQGHELARYGATAVELIPGWLRSEMMLGNFGVGEDNWRDAVGAAAPADFALSETPRFAGRAVAALAADPGQGSPYPGGLGA
jgi:NAD(P)-dependent dehydrogenase (short-subunit alcohol dehydrogenase family)